MELWDAYDENGNYLGLDLIRGRPIPEGARHIVADVVVKHRDGDYLLMRRDRDKEGWPGFWEPGASGSVLKGESLEEGAFRELSEETGLDCASLTHLGRAVTHNTIYETFLAVTHAPKHSVTLQAGETIDYLWLGKQDLLGFIKGNLVINQQIDRLLACGALE